jgi:uncharacterized membrane protein
LRRILRPFLTAEEKKRVAAAIAQAETKTSGEIHVHIVSRLGKTDALEAAKILFFKLGLDKTKARNGVLILVSHLDHRFAVWGDEGVHARAGQALWDKAKHALLKHFAERRYPEGIEACVREVGLELAALFPKDGPDEDELPNEVTES